MPLRVDEASSFWPKPYHRGYYERYIANRPASYCKGAHGSTASLPTRSFEPFRFAAVCCGPVSRFAAVSMLDRGMLLLQV
jgi:hypothetical protein